MKALTLGAAVFLLFSIPSAYAGMMETVPVGDGRVDSPWSQPWISGAGDYHEEFPSGVVERSKRLGMAWEYSHARALCCTMSWDYFDVENYQNVRGQKEKFNQLRLNLSLRFRGPVH